MARTTSVALVRRKTTAVPYDNSNERLNAIMDGETVWICQGAFGRTPVIADTEADAIERYIEKKMSEILREQEEAHADD